MIGNKAMRTLFILLLVPALLLPAAARGDTMKAEKVPLPEPRNKGSVSVAEAISKRRTVRGFKPKALTLDQLSQILWAAQGITDKKRGFRSAPSGGALYPLDVYAVVGKEGVEDFGEGVYLYLPHEHALRKVADGDRRKDVARAAIGQNWIAQAPVVLTITAEYERITRKYGHRGIRYARIETGHVGQNIFLQSEASGLSAGIVGAFEDQSIAEIIGALDNHEPLLIMPVGYKK
jgi:SagB-type dehydrogenase family enzyme